MEPLDVHASLELPADPRSASRARRFIRDFCRAADLDDEYCENASLLVSELVTNAVLHGRSRAVLDVRRPPPVLRVWVRDDNPALPPVGISPELTAESGRGLVLVSALASRWGVEATEDGGKAVWFELDPAA
jgi:anti-sigma regulatory factor (Ser/Thr protein kinase)